MAFCEGKFPVVLGGPVREVRGWIDEKRGIGLYRNILDEWWVIHLNTGHGIVKMLGESLQVLPVARQIAEVTDWTFTDIRGWANRDPGLPTKLNSLAREHPERLIRSPETQFPDEASEEAAQRIGLARTDAEGEA